MELWLFQDLQQLPLGLLKLLLDFNCGERSRIRRAIAIARAKAAARFGSKIRMI
jgi:hypothetical protein